MTGPIVVVTATGLETRAARRAIGARARIVRAGIGLKRLRAPLTGAAISCGVAGALRSGVPTGTVVIPRSVSTEDGPRRECDPQLVNALSAAARAMGFEPLQDPLLSAKSLVRGDLRSKWAQLGFAAVDMESALIDAPKIACVRVVLDTPDADISDAWEHPAAVLFRPRAWRDIPFLLREAPRCADRAARVIACALESL